jgi:hypothetical protein
MNLDTFQSFRSQIRQYLPLDNIRHPHSLADMDKDIDCCPIQTGLEKNKQFIIIKSIFSHTSLTSTIRLWIIAILGLQVRLSLSWSS